MSVQPEKRSFGNFREIVILILLLCSGWYFGFWYHVKWQEDRAWAEVLENPTIVGFEQYIDERPGGRYAEEARSLIKRMKKMQDEVRIIKERHTKKASEKRENTFLLDQERKRDSSMLGKAESQESNVRNLLKL